MNNNNLHIYAGLFTAILTLLLSSSCATPREGMSSFSPSRSIPEQHSATQHENEGVDAIPDSLMPDKREIVNTPVTDNDTDKQALASKTASKEKRHLDSAISDTAKTDLWERIRQGFKLNQNNDKRVTAEKNWYAKHQEYLDRTAERAQPYLHLIVEEVEKRGMPTEIALLPIVESAFQPFAYSHGRAAGLWQFIPGTAKVYGLKQNWWYDGRRDVEASTHAALDYLQHLNKIFDGDWLLALAAYNSGSGTVNKAIRKNRKRGKSTDFWNLKLPKETSAYVPKLLAISSIVADPQSHNVSLKAIADEPYLTKVNTGSQIDLALAADLADISLHDIYRYNPGYNRWATDPNGSHQLLVPVDRAEQFNNRLAELPTDKRIKWARHRIHKGETLSHISKKYRTTPSLIRKVNKLNTNNIRAGKSLIIPVAAKDLDDYSLSMEQRLLKTQNAPRSGHRVSYTVKKGDTLWDISRAYKVNVNSLAKWNAMAPRDMLRPGQKLVIWLRPSSKAASVALGPSSNAVTQRIYYTVRKGDSLARISQRFNVRISELLEWNALSREKYLQPGQKLTLYVDVTQQTENI